MHYVLHLSLQCSKDTHCEMSPYLELFWSTFSRIQTEYGDFDDPENV